MSPPSGNADSGSGGPGRKQAGGAGAVLGFRVIQNSGIQGVALVAGNILQLATIGVVAGFLGPADLGRYSLLLFLGSLITMIFSLAVKPGTIRRTFGSSDDDDDDDDDDDGEETAAISPKHTLGAGVLWSAVLGLLATGLVVVLRQPIADLLLGGEADATLVLWAGILGASGILFKVASISLWFERRPVPYLIVEIARPLLSLLVMTILLIDGGGVSHALAGVAIGTAISAVMAAVFLRSSFEPNFDPKEVVAIVSAAGRRIPIVTSLWAIQNADVFLLSRFVDHTDLGIYSLASKLGLIVSFLPQGFRVAMRPLRKSAVFKAMRSEYGRSTASGQLMGYFVLISISSILMMVLGGEVLLSAAPDSFEDAAPLIPLTGTALVMPPLWRTVNGQTSWPDKTRAWFVGGTVGAALLFGGLCWLLAPEIGIYAAPVAIIAGLGTPVAYFFIRSQLGPNRMEFPYGEIARALLAAVIIGVGFHLLPELHPIAEAAIAAVLLALYVALLFILRVVPEAHWPAFSQMASSLISGRADRFNPRRGLRALEVSDRGLLRMAVNERMSPGALAAPARSEEPAPGPNAAETEMTEGARMVRVLRVVGRRGGAPVTRRTRWDGAVAEFVFADEPPAVRNASMRALLSRGADAADLRALEDLVQHLVKVPPDGWEGAPASESPKGRRRRAAGHRSREALTRALAAINRRI
jgi:O-antigen/teichoic acid export membrane protein